MQGKVQSCLVARWGFHVYALLEQLLNLRNVAVIFWKFSCCLFTITQTLSVTLNRFLHALGMNLRSTIFSPSYVKRHDSLTFHVICSIKVSFVTKPTARVTLTFVEFIYKPLRRNLNVFNARKRRQVLLNCFCRHKDFPIYWMSVWLG